MILYKNDFNLVDITPHTKYVYTSEKVFLRYEEKDIKDAISTSIKDDYRIVNLKYLTIQK